MYKPVDIIMQLSTGKHIKSGTTILICGATGTSKFLYKTPVVLDNTNLLLINTYQLHIAIILLSLCNTLRITAQSALTIRLDSDLKMQFDSLCEEFGMSTNTAFNIYVRQVVRSRRIPFAIEAPAKDDIMDKGRAAFYEMRQAAADAGIQDMSLDEINEEIRLARESK